MSTKPKQPIQIQWDFSYLLWMETPDDDLGTKYQAEFIEQVLHKPLNKYRVAALIQLIDELSILGSKNSDKLVVCSNDDEYNQVQVKIQNFKHRLSEASPRLMRAALQWLDYLKVEQAITSE